jgi:alpha-1,6-mannosyltransferase
VVFVLDGMHLRGFAFIALAVAVKATALLVAPFLVWVWAARLTGSARHRFLVAAGVGGAVFVIVFGAASMVAGVGLGWIGVLKSQTPLLTWLSLPCAAAEILFYSIGTHIPGWTREGFLSVFRVLGMIALAFVLVRQWWLAREGGVDAIKRATIALLAASLLAPSVLPWYLTWALALGAAFAWSNRSVAVLGGISVWMVLITLPDGTVVWRWTYDNMNPWVWWPYLAATMAVGVWVAKTLQRPTPVPEPSPEPVPTTRSELVGGTGG